MAGCLQLVALLAACLLASAAVARHHCSRPTWRLLLDVQPPREADFLLGPTASKNLDRSRPLGRWENTVP